MEDKQPPRIVSDEEARRIYEEMQAERERRKTKSQRLGFFVGWNAARIRDAFNASDSNHKENDNGKA